MDEALLSISLTSRGQLVKMLITLEPHGIFGSYFAYFFISTLYSYCHGMQNGDEAAGRIKILKKIAKNPTQNLC